MDFVYLINKFWFIHLCCGRHCARCWRETIKKTRWDSCSVKLLLWQALWRRNMWCSENLWQVISPGQRGPLSVSPRGTTTSCLAQGLAHTEHSAQRQWPPSLPHQGVLALALVTWPRQSCCPICLRLQGAEGITRWRRRFCWSRNCA